jgi:hypothetical protein
MNRTLIVAPLAGLAAGAVTFAGVAAARGHHSTETAMTTNPVVVKAQPASEIKPAQTREITAYLTGDTNNVLHYRTARWIPGGVDNGHYEVGRLGHSLPLAARPDIRSAVNVCSAGQVTMDRNGNATKKCSKAQLASSLHSGYRSYVTLKVNAANHITAVLEHYVP